MRTPTPRPLAAPPTVLATLSRANRGWLSQEPVAPLARLVLGPGTRALCGSADQERPAREDRQW